MQIHQRLPGSKSHNAGVMELSKRIVKSCKARHALSVTLTRGHGLIYFEPLVVGGENKYDVNSLYCIAKSMHEELSENV
jgi:hypothetical protein